MSIKLYPGSKVALDPNGHVVPLCDGEVPIGTVLGLGAEPNTVRIYANGAEIELYSSHEAFCMAGQSQPEQIQQREPVSRPLGAISAVEYAEWVRRGRIENVEPFTPPPPLPVPNRPAPEPGLRSTADKLELRESRRLLRGAVATT